MAFDFHSVMSGRRQDPLASIMRGALAMASLGYRAGVASRNRAFDRGRREIISSDAVVLSVGNLTTGGTGKTPMVCFLAQAFRAHGIRVAIVSRGYGRGQGDANDEALELFDRLPDVPHVQDPDRVAAARIATEELESQLILMDDGFQHRRLHRDFDILVIDATCPFGYGHLLPRGLLREPITGLSRADLVIISRSDLVDDRVLEQIDATVRRIEPSMPIVRSVHAPTTLLNFPDENYPSTQLRGQDVALLSAIGNSDAFAQTVITCGARVVAQVILPDHDPYAPETVRELMKWAESLQGRASRIICTHKDWVKLRMDRLGGIPLQALQIELQLTAGAELLNQEIAKLAAKCPDA